MSKIKLHVNNDERNLSLTVFLILADESPKFEIPEIDLAEETCSALSTHFSAIALDSLATLQETSYKNPELTSCIIHVYRYYPELKALALLHCIVRNWILMMWVECCVIHS
ncbi:hypothetical protein V1506DRAFT_550309 [Lipomyces tetrasporus]